MTGARIDIDVFSTLLESVYESAVDPDQWRVFLQGLAAALNAKSGMFRVIDEQLPAIRANVHYNLDPELQEAHRQYFVTRDVYIEALRDHPGGFIAPGEAILDLNQLRKTEFFADYMQPQDSYHVCGGLAMRNEELTIKFGLQRDRRTGPFSRADADFIRRFVPHIQRAARLGHLLDLTHMQNAAAERALESLAVGALLLDEDENVVHANTKAEEILRGRHGLARVQGRLGATRGGDAGRLRDLIATVRSRAVHGGPPVPATLLLTAAPGEAQLLLVAVPITPGQPRFRGPWPRASVAVFVSNLADAGLINHDVLGSLYGLTPAEARLACALARGRELGSLSEEWGISRETLRTHLKRVLGKTGTARQADLVRLLTGKPWNLLNPSAASSA
ncbi:MAG TPA: helix-turn-helix transcriptional regulator [Gammaproteobacteria bacterium]|nr:helix-turn-helix transcriptional regulator [Gammaproteobacteria bacterium]